MKVCQKMMISLFLSMLFLIGMLTVTVSLVMAVKSAPERLIFDEYVLGTGGEIVSPILGAGKLYRIVADEIFWHDYPNNLAADAQYYTTDGSNSWDWVSYLPAPGGHSFLQINHDDVYWGPFSNGDTGHTYTLHYTGAGAEITFRIWDWVDGTYTNNDCKIRVRIYEPVTIGGYVVDSNPWEMVMLLTIGAVMAVVLIIPVIKYHRKTHRGIG